MSRNEITIAAPPAQVYAALIDARRYDRWVVGARTIRAVDPEWPAPGARFHHTLGIGPLTLKDTTAVLERRENELLVLKANARPVGAARVSFRLHPEASGTRVVMEEEAISALARIAWKPVLDGMTHVRNERCLQKLKQLIEEGATPGAR